MIIEYRLRNDQVRKYLIWPLIKLIGVIVLITALSIYWFEVDKQNVFFVIMTTWLWVGLVHILPLLVLAIKHIKMSKNSCLWVNNATGDFEYQENEFKSKFNWSTIENVIKIVSPPKYDDRMDFIGWGYFFCWKVILVDGTIIFLSCMLLDSEEFFGQKYEREKQMFPVPKNIFGSKGS
uniref:hypothetical protein n=1 Tax=Roseivirga sp. TaxID=1964215 RepID=UPI0040473F82